MAPSKQSTACSNLPSVLARGFRSLRYFRIMAYLKAAGLHLNLPSSSRPSLPTQNSEWPKFDSFPRRSRDNEHLSASRLSGKESVNERVDFEEGSPAAREIFENWVKRVTPGGPTEALCSRHFFDRMIPSLNLAQRFPPEL